MSVEVTTAPTQEPPKLAARVRLYDLAKRAREEAGGDTALARTMLCDQLTNDHDLLISVVPEIVDYAFRRGDHNIRQSFHANSQVPDLDKPKRLSFMPKPEAKSALIAEIEAAKNRIRSWMTYPLPGGKALGDASFEEVKKAADFYGAQAAGNALKARILRAVAERAPWSSAIVRDHLTDEDIEEIVRGES